MTAAEEHFLARAINYCQIGSYKKLLWDERVNSLVGHAESGNGGGYSTNRFLFFDSTQNLRLDTGTYNIGQDSEINRLLMVAFKIGQNYLQDLDCESANTTTW